MQAVVLCGGLATRLGSRAAKTPKILLEVGGRPFLDRLVDQLEAAGFERMLLCAGHLADALDDALARRSWPLAVEIARDGDTQLGTGGAIRRALPRLEASFLLTYGDSYLRFDHAQPLRRLRAEPRAGACMATWENHDAIEPSNVAVSNGWVARYDKARGAGTPPLTAIDYGAIALRRETVDELDPDTVCDLAPLLSRLAARGALLACPVAERFFEIGSLEGLAALEAHLGGAA